MKKTYLALVVVVALVIAFFAIKDRRANAPEPPTPGTVEPVLGADPLNATYRLDNIPVTLVQGRAESAVIPGSASKIVTTVFGEPAIGDLDGDGESDAAVILVQNTGGSGTFFYVGAAMKKADGYLGTNAVLLGDRIAPQTIENRNSIIIANYATRGPDEPMTARPSMGASKYLVYREGALVDVPISEKGEMFMEGMFVWGHEVRSFTPCGSKEQYWAPGQSSIAEEIKELAALRTAGQKPYTPFFVSLAGVIVEPPTDGFGADYDNALKITKIIASPASGTCR